MKEIYETRDLPLTAYLVLRDVHFTDRISRGGVVYFIFPKVKSLDSLILDYHSGKGLVEPVAYWETLKRLRRFVMNTLNNQT
jgi:hypothetical protein